MKSSDILEKRIQTSVIVRGCGMSEPVACGTVNLTEHLARGRCVEVGKFDRDYLKLALTECKVKGSRGIEVVLIKHEPGPYAIAFKNSAAIGNEYFAIAPIVTVKEE